MQHICISPSSLSKTTMRLKVFLLH